MFRWRSALCSVVLVSATTFLAVPPALGSVEVPLTRVELSDGTDDVWSITDSEQDSYQPAGRVPTVDATKAVVAHRKFSLVVRVKFVDLRRVHHQSVAALISTRDRFLIGLAVAGPGSRAGRDQLVDYELGKVRCPGMTHRYDYDADRVSMRIPRACLKRPRWVKVSVLNSLYKEVDGVFTELTDNPHNAKSSPGSTPRLRRAQ
jgi:hypothetical protein